MIATSLFLDKKCNLPGIGTLLLVSRSAKSDFLNTRILSPTQTIEFIADGRDNNLSTDFLELSNFIKTKLTEEGTYLLNGIGTFTRQGEAEVQFTPVVIDPAFTPDVEAVRVIRQDAIHEILVGDQQTTNTEMIDYFNEKTPLFDRWWVWAIVLSAIGLILMLIYFSQRGLNLLGNTSN